MEIKKYITNLLGANCYLLVHQQSAVVIDPAGIDDQFIADLKKREINLIGIINTHGHIDHIMGNQRLRAATRAPIWIHQDDGPYLTDPNLNLAPLVTGGNYVGPAADRLLSHGEIIKVGGLELEVIHTPGHSPGSVCLLGPGFLFSGDTLFALSIGRSDLPGGDGKVLQESLKKLVQKVPTDTIIYPGHGEGTTMKRELTHNPFLR